MHGNLGVIQDEPAEPEVFLTQLTPRYDGMQQSFRNKSLELTTDCLAPLLTLDVQSFESRNL